MKIMGHACLVALAEFLRTRHAELQERFQREDIAWAVAEAKPEQAG